MLDKILRFIRHRGVFVLSSGKISGATLSGEWKKFADGRSELVVSQKVTIPAGTNNWLPWGNNYYYSHPTVVPFPEGLFLATGALPIQTAQCFSEGGRVWGIFYSNTHKQTGKIDFLRPNTTNEKVDIIVNYIIKGYWK